MADISHLRRALIARILEGDGCADRAQRRAAFDNAGLAEPAARLIDQVARQAYRITDEDVAQVRAAGLSEDQIFELAVCAAVGQATRQHDAAVAALRAATEQERSEHATVDPR